MSSEGLKLLGYEISAEQESTPPVIVTLVLRRDVARTLRQWIMNDVVWDDQGSPIDDILSALYESLSQIELE